MDWSNIVSLVMAILVLIALPLALRRRKKAGSLKREEFCRHLQGMGIEAALRERGSDEEKIGLSSSSGQRSEGIIELKDRNIDLVNVISIASQYGVRYLLDYLVKASNVMEERTLKKTWLTKKKSPPLWGKVVAIDWKGDDSLAQSLNLDYSLEDKLLRADVNVFKGNIWIFPEPRHGYARIRTDYVLPSAAMFEAISSIARHIKSW
jgi:hypothetical protein